MSAAQLLALAAVALVLLDIGLRQGGLLRIAQSLIWRVGCAREPDQLIPQTGSPYMRRWCLVPKNPLLNVYLHQFLRSDDERALHDHPWLFNVSLLLEGQYVEHTIRAGGVEVQRRRQSGSLKVRFGPAPHRIRLLQVEHGGRPNGAEWHCWTLFITGPLVRSWGFHCRHGWVPSSRFGQKGCDA